MKIQNSNKKMIWISGRHEKFVEKLYLKIKEEKLPVWKGGINDYRFKVSRLDLSVTL